MLHLTLQMRHEHQPILFVSASPAPCQEQSRGKKKEKWIDNAARQPKPPMALQMFSAIKTLHA